MVVEADTQLPDGDVPNIKVLHVVGAFHVIMDHTLPCAPERLNGINLSLLEGKTRGQIQGW